MMGGPRILYDGKNTFLRLGKPLDLTDETINLTPKELRVLLRDISEVIWGHYTIEPKSK